MGEPISRIPQSLQLQAYQRFSNPMEAKRLFEQLSGWENEAERLKSKLIEWMCNEGPESWDEWRSKHGG